MTTDPRTIAARLGVDELIVQRLQARGYLLRFDADEAEVRTRLFAAHVRARSPRGTSPKREGPRPAA